jgi:hypothetical protein
MSKTITVKKDDTTGDHYIDLTDLADLLDISRVVYYSMETQDDSLILTFFDNEKQPVLPN